ncbi:ATP-binding protein [Streptomyces sp. NPDC002588]|uniref:ATP-binding protein n=1 Tax=Streptomyces sp. NPDC002588 TaxID=3154419 RepID=UPI00332BAC6B
MSNLDGGRVAARGFQYQYLRTLEALLAAWGRPDVDGCRIEGPAPENTAPAVDVVDFDLVDRQGECLVAAQVKSAAPGRRSSAPEAFAVLAAMVTKSDAKAYELITTAVPDAKCRLLAATLAGRSQKPEELRVSVAQLLGHAPRAIARLQALSAEEVERLGRSRIVFDSREEAVLRRDLHDQLRQRRTQHRAGLGERSAGLILGYLTAEVLRRAATSQEAFWSISDFTNAVLVEDDVLIRALGRKDWAAVYGPVTPVPDIVRPALLAKVADALTPADSAPGDVRSCVVTGLSGIGKSSTAAAYVAEHADTYDLIFWADASTTESLTASFRRLCGHLHGQLDAQSARSADHLREQVHELLSSLPGRWLIVLDDAFADIVSPWIPRLGRGDVLITSIDNAGWTWARHRVSVDRMSTDQACELMTRRLALTDSDAERHRQGLATLAEALDGWPLAIELACGYLKSCAIPVNRIDQYRHALLSRALDDRFSIPHGYPRTLVAAVDLSLARLIRLLAGDQQLSRQVREVLGYLTNFAPQRIPIHLAAVSAFFSPEDVPTTPLSTAVDESNVPLREIFRALVKVSFVRYTEPLAPLSTKSPVGIDDTVSMNAVLQEILRQYYEKAPGSKEALSRCAFHTDRWLYISMEISHADRSWELAQHAAALAAHARRRDVKDNHTAVLLGNLAGFKKLQGEVREAIELLALELAWLDEIEEPNEVLQAQTRIQLAHAHQIAELPGEADEALRLLTPVLAYIEHIRQEESARNAAAVLTAEAAAILEELLRRHASNERLVHLYRAFTTLSGTLPTPSTVAEMAQARTVGRLIEAGETEAAERAAREALASYGDDWTGNSAEVQRILIEALSAQRRWQEAETEFESFLARTRPRSLHRFAEQMLVHNVGLTCALAWVVAGDEAAAALLNRIVSEIDVDALSKQVPLVERTRYTLLKAVAAASRNDTSTFETLMHELGAHPLDKETNEEMPWEDLLHRLIGRLRHIASTTVHENLQLHGEELLQALPPGWQRHPNLARALERSDVSIRLALSSESPFDVLGHDALPTAGAVGKHRSLALAIMEPTHMLAIGTANSLSLELQVHRICSSGFRLVVPEAFTVPTPAGWQLRRRRGQLTLKDSAGILRARARIRPQQKWLDAADRHRRVLVLYGFGFDLNNPAQQNEAFASRQAFYSRLNLTTARHLLAAGLVPWKS